MILTHAGKHPRIDPTAWIAPDATVCGDVTVGPDARVMHGARVIGESGGTIHVGRACIIRENAVIRADTRHDCTIGDYCLIGPQAHVAGATLEDQVFVATGAVILHGAHLGRNVEVRVHATVHLRTTLPPNAMVPIGWVAVGDPVRILPPERHEEIWAVQAPLDFPKAVYGFDRETPDLNAHVNRRLSAELEPHRSDTVYNP